MIWTGKGSSVEWRSRTGKPNATLCLILHVSYNLWKLSVCVNGLRFLAFSFLFNFKGYKWYNWVSNCCISLVTLDNAKARWNLRVLTVEMSCLQIIECVSRLVLQEIGHDDIRHDVLKQLYSTCREKYR